jgi:hypothetical protein
VARDIALRLRRKYLLGCVVVLHDDILAIMAKMVNGLGVASTADEMRFVNRPKVSCESSRPIFLRTSTISNGSARCSIRHLSVLISLL